MVQRWSWEWLKARMVEAVAGTSFVCHNRWLISELALQEASSE